MIFYIIIPDADVQLHDFNDSCRSRLRFFLQVEDGTADYDTHVESLIPGTIKDRTGHFILRAWCLQNPIAKDFLLKHEFNLFCHRLNHMKEHEMRDACQAIIQETNDFSNYKIRNPLTEECEMPYNMQKLFSALQSFARVLLSDDVCKHFAGGCSEHCNQHTWEVPFYMCPNLVKTRSVIINKGLSRVYCSQWKPVLEELFKSHFHIGISVLSNTVIDHMLEDERWVMAWKVLKKMYDTYKKSKPQLPTQDLTAKNVDAEQKYFPPCMWLLLSVLRKKHRLTYQWRYKFALFLKDMGLSVEENIEFWKNEYSKCCAPDSSCKHSWDKDAKKYVYSTRHLYGLEGVKVPQKSKDCGFLQLTAREEGGCPFVHFDEENLQKVLGKGVMKNADLYSQICSLREEKKPQEACSLYMTSLTKERLKRDVTLEYDSPIECYYQVKSCMNESLEW